MCVGDNGQLLELWSLKEEEETNSNNPFIIAVDRFYIAQECSECSRVENTPLSSRLTLENTPLSSRLTALLSRVILNARLAFRSAF